MPIITALAFFLIIGGIIALFANPIAREGSRAIGPQSNLLIPGLNPYLPIADGWIALIIAMVVHEAGHGIVARVHGVKVESTGIVLLFILPIGAFVNIEKDELDRISLKHRSSILTAGITTNMIFAGISLLLIFLITSSLNVVQPATPNTFGVEITDVTQKSLAQNLGLTKGSIIQQIQTKDIKTPTQLNGNLSANLGNTISITWLNDKGQHITKQVVLPKERTPGKGILGVAIIEVSDPQKVLNTYNTLFASNPLLLFSSSNNSARKPRGECPGTLDASWRRGGLDELVQTRGRDRNPYIAFGGLIAAGSTRIDRGLELERPAPIATDPATLTDQEREALGAHRYPTSLDAALGEFETDEVLTSAMGDLLTRSYLAVRSSEWEAYSAADDDLPLPPALPEVLT